jgi:Chalcone isomerase-like
MRIVLFQLRVWAMTFLLCATSFAGETRSIDQVFSPVKLQGSGRLTWWGFSVYDAALYRSTSLTSPEFALDLRYQKSFKGVSIANRTTEEMKRIGVPEAQAVSWGKQLAGFMPNVESGQNLTAVYTPNQGTIFYHEGKQIAQIPGVDFPKAFFGIWLDQKTSAPKLREQLLGQNCPPPLFNETCEQ